MNYKQTDKTCKELKLMSGAEQVLTVLTVPSSTEVTFAVSEPDGI